MIKRILKKLTPAPILQGYRWMKLQALRSRNQRLSTKEVFTTIYRTNAWGGAKGEFCSGSGSYPSFAPRYAATVHRICEENSLNSIVDLGCGDFTLGRHLAKPGMKYTGVDIVEELIARNQKEFSDELVSFISLNIIEDELPDGDICLIRQVLQHLSNEQILKVLGKMARYRMVIVTEHYPVTERFHRANLDKPHGPDTRIDDHSAVCLDQPPFNVSNLEEVLSVQITEPGPFQGDSLRSFLIRLPEKQIPSASAIR